MSEGTVNEPKWYVIHTYSGYENKVMTSLMNMVENMQLQDYSRGCKNSRRRGHGNKE